MKYLKDYKIFESVSEVEVHALCKVYDIENYTINPDDTIDVDDDVYLSNRSLTKLPLKFNKVTGSFYCSDNQLVSLEGSPKEVRGDFDCGYNQLTSLEGAPKEVGDYFNCSYNQLTSLLGAPERIVDDFTCYNNKIISLEGLLWKSFKSISLGGNPVYHIVGKWINNDNHEELIEYFIDLDVIQGETVIMDRLKAFHEEMGIDMDIDFEEVKKYYKIIE